MAISGQAGESNHKPRLTFAEALKAINDPGSSLRLSSKAKGDRFEYLTRNYFLADPLYCNDIENIWLWDDVPFKEQFPGSGIDTGIDIVVRTKGSGDNIEYWAIQAKNRDYVNKKEISGFLDTASRSWKAEDGRECNFSHRYLVAATDDITRVVRQQFVDRSFAGAIIDYNALSRADVDWRLIIEGKKQDRSIAKPRDYQAEILDSVKNYFAKDGNDRGKLIMACGTGKTLTSLWIAEQETKNQGAVLFLVPSLALMSQSLREWKNNSKLPFKHACVCSDKTVDYEVYSDENITNIRDLPYPVTTNKDELLHRLSLIDKTSKGMRVVFATYQSLDVVIQTKRQFDLIICDEAPQDCNNRLFR